MSLNDILSVIIMFRLIEMCVLMFCTQKMKGGAMLDGVVKVAKMLQSRPHSWTDCVSLSRVKFEKYFNHRVTTMFQQY